MPSRPKTTASDYYDLTPSVGHVAGDIWSDLPAYGLLGRTHVRGLVVTPACDLSNRKVETIAYLPILSVSEYFGTVSFLPELLRALRGQLVAANAGTELPTRRHFEYPEPDAIATVSRAVESRLAMPGLNQKERSALDRMRAGLSLLTRSGELAGSPAAPGALHTLFGEKEWKNIVRDIVRNAYSADLHFLPADGEPAEWSGVLEPSVVLFRYPLCCPIQVLDAAQDLELVDWPRSTADLQRRFPAAEHFVARRPLKHSTLKTRFFSDLLTRYAAMYVRLGAPDFTSDTIESIADAITMGIK